MQSSSRYIRGLLVLLGLLLGAVVRAADVSVAVAANFAAPMNALAEEFARDSGHRVKLSFASSGKFYAQIRNGAPFEVLLSADEETPARLEAEGLAVPGSRFTYAIGRLVLWSADAQSVDSQAEVLRHGRFRKLAIANPKLAPYGKAAFEVLQGLGLYAALSGKLVQGENIAQTHQFVASGNAELGFVAASQVMKNGRLDSGSAWPVPERLHSPIRQDAVMLARGRNNPAAMALLAYLKTDKARTIIAAHGYR